MGFILVFTPHTNLLKTHTFHLYVKEALYLTPTGLTGYNRSKGRGSNKSGISEGIHERKEKQGKGSAGSS